MAIRKVRKTPTPPPPVPEQFVKRVAFVVQESNLVNDRSIDDFAEHVKQVLDDSGILSWLALYVQYYYDGKVYTRDTFDPVEGKPTGPALGDPVPRRIVESPYTSPIKADHFTDVSVPPRTFGKPSPQSSPQARAKSRLSGSQAPSKGFLGTPKSPTRAQLDAKAKSSAKSSSAEVVRKIRKAAR